MTDAFAADLVEQIQVPQAALIGCRNILNGKGYDRAWRKLCEAISLIETAMWLLQHEDRRKRETP